MESDFDLLTAVGLVCFVIGFIGVLSGWYSWSRRGRQLLKDELNAALAMQESLNEKIGDFRQELVDLKNKVRSYEGMCEEKDSHITKLEIRNKYLEDATDRFMNLCRELEDKKGAMSKRVDELKKQLSIARGLATKYKNQLKKSKPV